jgi:hypothetical protein
MYSVLIFPGGRRVDAVLLSSTPDALRFAISGRSDVTELQKIGDRWVNDAGLPVELGCLIAFDTAKQRRPRTMAAHTFVAS